jgi:outer membrane protein OmpA-like peptidoglycan-associated protein
MKKSLLFIVLSFVLVFGSEALAQSTKYTWLAKDSWAFGFGGTYPRYVNTSLTVQSENDYGGFLSIQKNFTEHVGLRLEANYLRLEGRFGQNGRSVENQVIAGNLGVVYYFVPCEPVSPYLSVGLGGIYYTIDNSPRIVGTNTTLDDSYLDYQINFNFGSEWRIGENWKLKTELGYHSVATSKFDGVYGTGSWGGLLGGPSDTYMTFDLGLLYYFGYGEKSNICDLYEGIEARVDYDRIENMIKKYATPPTEVDYNRIEEIVKKYKSGGSAAVEDNWVLLGINFDFNKANIKPEALPIMYHAAEVLLANPDIKVEIQGHTDNIGSDGYNQKLSERRAQTVRDFLVAKGVAANRLTTVGFGETRPVLDNNTPQNRELNRRIEFKVLNK